MKKVLIIANLAHATPRVPGIARYLPEHGWEPVILTSPVVEKPVGTLKIIETSYRDTLALGKRLFGIKPGDDARTRVKQRLGVSARRSFMDFILTRVGEVVNYPDAEKGWKPFAIARGAEVLAGEGIDAIISSSSPVTAHLIAAELKRRYKVPWVAELRDPWSQNHNYIYSSLRRRIDRRLEVKTLAGADALVTVGRPWADKLGQLHNNKVTHVITNGFDPDMVRDAPRALTGKFTITYTGRIYREWQDITRLFAALRDLIDEGTVDPDDIEVRFYGERHDWLDGEIRGYGLSGVARQYGRRPPAEALEKQRESQVLLLLDWDDRQETGVYPGKVFEYLAAGRPVLATGGVSGNVISRLLADTRAGVHAVTAEDVKRELAVMYREYQAKGAVFYSGNETEISRYSYRALAESYAGVLNGVAGSTP